VALDLAAAVMAGGHFIEQEVISRGGVLFIAAEGGADIDTRLRAVIETKYPDLHKAPFAWVDQCPRLVDRDSAAQLAAIAQQAAMRMQSDFGLPLVLIIIDTIVAAAGYSKSGEENDTPINQMIMNSLTALSRATGGLVLGVDHFGKAVETGTRGSSAKEAAADVVLALLADKTLTGTVSNTRLALRKSRVAASGQEFQFLVRVVDLGFDERGRSVTSLVIDWLPIETVKAAKSDEANWSKSLRLLRRCLMSIGNRCRLRAAAISRRPTRPRHRHRAGARRVLQELSRHRPRQQGQAGDVTKSVPSSAQRRPGPIANWITDNRWHYVRLAHGRKVRWIAVQLLGSCWCLLSGPWLPRLQRHFLRAFRHDQVEQPAPRLRPPPMQPRPASY
jgi:hypothetical protein